MLVTVVLSLSRDPRARVGVIGVLGIYFAVAGFAHFGGLHNTFTGSLGIFLVVITFALLVAIARQQGHSVLASLTAEGPAPASDGG